MLEPRKNSASVARKKYKDFSELEVIQNSADTKKTLSTKFSHNISKVTKKSYKRKNKNSSSFWYSKEENNMNYFGAEIVSQELHRLLIEDHPKTRGAANLPEKKRYIISKEVVSSEVLKFNEECKNNLLCGKIFGLGEILIMALWLNEVDLKQGNLLVNPDGRIIKIDGDWSFAKLTKAKYAKFPFTINFKDIENLPFIDEFFHPVFNWLNVIVAEKKYEDSFFIKNNKFIKNKSLRQEINKTILKIICLPDSLISDIVNANAPNELCKKFTAFILERKQQLLKAALPLKSFQDYINSSQANIDLEKFIEQIKGFKIRNKIPIISEQKSYLILKEIKDDFDLIKISAKNTIPEDSSDEEDETSENSSEETVSDTGSPIIEKSSSSEKSSSEAEEQPESPGIFKLSPG